MSFPRDVLEQAEARRLGDPVRAFDARAGRRRALAWMILLGLAGLCLIPATLIYVADRDYWLGVPAALLSAAYLAGGGWILWRTLTRGGLRGGRLAGGHLFSYGMVLTWQSGPSIAYRWDDLAAVTTSGVQRVPHGPTRWRFVIDLAEGDWPSIVLDDEVPGVRDLGETVAAEVTAQAVPRGLAAVQAGETVDFGPFRVGPDGVGKEGERITWPGVREVEIDNGLVLVHAYDQRVTLAATASRTPNAIAFVDLCHHLQALYQAAELPGPRQAPDARRQVPPRRG